jgi:hypothetical protein
MESPEVTAAGMGAGLVGRERKTPASSRRPARAAEGGQPAAGHISTAFDMRIDQYADSPDRRK